MTHLNYTLVLDTTYYGIDNFDRWLSSKNYNDEELSKLKGAMTPSVLQNIVGGILNDSKKKYGILCLSEIKDSTLMWSHYAEKHSGICIGFKFPALTSDVICFKVSYHEKIYPIEYSLDESIEASFAKLMYWICAKSKDWEYENEVRRINIKHNGVIPFDTTNLCEIYFGVATPQTEIDIIKEIIKGKGYNIDKAGKMVINKTDFLLDVVPYQFS